MSGDFWVLTDLTNGTPLMHFPTPTMGSLPFSLSVYKISSAVIEGNSYSDIQVIADGISAVWWVKGTGIVKLTRLVGGNIQTSLLLRKK